MKQRISRPIVLFLTAVCAPQATAGTAFVAFEDKVPFCEKLLNYINNGEAPSDAVAHIGAITPKFIQAQVQFQSSPTRPENKEEIRYAPFDVDSDGSNEILIKYLTSLRGQYGDIIWIVRREVKELVFKKSIRLNYEEFSQLEAIESTIPWPYESRGLFLVDIVPIQILGESYFSIRDTLFGNPSFPDRSWVIAKFSGRRLAPGGYGHETDDFETLCGFRRHR